MNPRLKKIVNISLICLMSASSAVVFKDKELKPANAFVALGYIASKNGANPEASAIIGIGGVIQGGIDGAVYGAVFGGHVGFIVGFGVGL